MGEESEKKATFWDGIKKVGGPFSHFCWIIFFAISSTTTIIRFELIDDWIKYIYSTIMLSITFYCIRIIDKTWDKMIEKDVSLIFGPDYKIKERTIGVLEKKIGVMYDDDPTRPEPTKVSDDDMKIMNVLKELLSHEDSSSAIKAFLESKIKDK